MKAKSKKVKKNLFIELKLKKFLKKVSKNGEATLVVPIRKKDSYQLEFLVKKDEDYNDLFVVFEFKEGIQTRVIPTTKVIASIKRITKNICLMNQFKVSFV